MFARYTSAVATGSLVTLSLFTFMQALIAMQPGAASEPRNHGTLTPVRVKPDEKTRIIEFEPVDKALKDPAPIAPRPEHANDVGIPVGLPRGRAPTPRLAVASTGLQMNDGPLVAIVRVQPVYPAAAQARDLEGWVLIEFDVLQDGQVVNARVVESSSRIFERAALRAAYRFRFKPRVVEGVPRPTSGIRNLFRFELRAD